MVHGGNYNNKKTACKHEDVNYIAAYQGMTDKEVKSHIMPLLAPGDGAYVDVPVQTQTPSGRHGSSFAVRGARFFASSSGEFYNMPPADPFA